MTFKGFLSCLIANFREKNRKIRKKLSFFGIYGS